MTYEVVTTAQAESDLRDIYEYIAFELLLPDNAAGTVTIIRVMYDGRDVDEQLSFHTKPLRTS